MRIATIVPSLRQVAPVFVATDLCEGFAARGHEATLFYLDDLVELVPVVPARRLTPGSFRQLAGYDIVHSHMLRPDLVATLVACMPGSRARFVSTLHSYVREDLANTHGRLASALFSRVWAFAWRVKDARVVLTRDAQSYYQSLLPGKDFIRIPNGRSPHRPAARPVAEHAALEQMRARFRVIGTNALVSRIKGLEQVVKVLPDLPGHAFVVAGDGPELEVLLRLAASLGVADRVLALGFKRNARDYLDYYDVYAMPSRSEGLGLALLEAAAAGLPVVCSRLPVFREIFDDDQASFFDLDNLVELRRALLRAGDDRIHLGAAARRRFEQGFSADVMVDAYLSLFEGLSAPSHIAAS